MADSEFHREDLASAYMADEAEVIRTGKPLIDRVETPADRPPHRILLEPHVVVRQSTDPDARRLFKHGKKVAGYNVQTAVDARDRARAGRHQVLIVDTTVQGVRIYTVASDHFPDDGQRISRRISRHT